MKKKSFFFFFFLVRMLDIEKDTESNQKFFKLYLVYIAEKRVLDSYHGSKQKSPTLVLYVYVYTFTNL